VERHGLRSRPACAGGGTTDVRRRQGLRRRRIMSAVPARDKCRSSRRLARFGGGR
jgi:hypothetical protein